jgi:FemAB-related protein (PEP-CTERM system-associated)
VIELCRFEGNEEESWDGYVDRCAHATHFHLNGWRRVIEQSYGHRPFYLWAKENGEPKGILPIVLIRSILFGRSLVSLPFLDYGGICADDPQTKIELYRAALELLTDHKADSLDLRHCKPIGLELPLQGTKITFTLELADNPDRMWTRLDGKTRNQIRKAQKSGLTVSWNGSESLSDFYDVFATNMRDLGSPVHSRRFFDALLGEFPESARMILVHK